MTELEIDEFGAIEHVFRVRIGGVAVLESARAVGIFIECGGWLHDYVVDHGCGDVVALASSTGVGQGNHNGADARVSVDCDRVPHIIGRIGVIDAF